MWHDITALGKRTRSNDVRCGMHHRVCAAHTVERPRVCHAIIAFRQHKKSNDIGRGMTSPPFECTHDQSTSSVARHQRSWTTHTVGNIGRGMTSSPLDSTHGRQRRAWHAITALGKLTWSDDLGCGMTSPPLDGTHDKTTSGVACHHHLWEAHTID